MQAKVTLASMQALKIKTSTTVGMQTVDCDLY